MGGFLLCGRSSYCEGGVLVVRGGILTGGGGGGVLL